jgi:serine/threonine-protein phosphatase CPPED1
LRRPVSDETGVPAGERKPVYPVRGTLVLDGCPVPGAMVMFYHPGRDKKLTHVGDGVTEADGSFTLSTYGAFDGAPAGDYVVTVTPFDPPAGPSKTPTLPAAYKLPGTSPLKAHVEAGENRLTFELKSDEKGLTPKPGAPKEEKKE